MQPACPKPVSFYESGLRRPAVDHIESLPRAPLHGLQGPHDSTAEARLKRTHRARPVLAPLTRPTAHVQVTGTVPTLQVCFCKAGICGLPAGNISQLGY